MPLCQICGNSIDVGCTRCPFCNSVQDKAAQQLDSATFYQKTVNLEQGLPTVEQALTRLQRELISARQEKIRILTIIHGYGSSGKGGAIRLECRKTLDYIHRRGEISSVIHGEHFNRHHGPTKHLLSRFRELSIHPHLNRNNKGITVIQIY